jgi:hypothetical protein
MPTLVLSPRYSEDSILIRKAAFAVGWNVERLSNWRAPEWLREADPVLYGEPLFAAVVSKVLDVALIEPPFHWLTTLPVEWLRRRVQFMTLAEARCAGRAFFKPADDKCFAAGVYEAGAKIPTSDYLPDTTPVLASEPVHWSVEYRCFILERQLIAICPYLRDGELCRAEDGSWPAPDAERAEATSFISTVLADSRVHIPPAVVIDVGIISEVGWAVIEANAVWASGMYGCNPTQVLPVLRRASQLRNSVTQADALWLPVRT